MATEIIHESEMGFRFEKTAFKKGHCKLHIIHSEIKQGGKEHAVISLEYKNVLGLSSPYLNWDNILSEWYMPGLFAPFVM